MTATFEIVGSSLEAVRAAPGRPTRLWCKAASFRLKPRLIQPGEQYFTFLTQVQDANGMVMDLSWTAGSIGFSESISLVAGFTPPEPGTYTVTAFAWRSLDDPTPLAAPVSLDVTVY